MAVAQTVPRHGPVLTGAYCIGLLLVFVGERIIGESGLVRTVLDGVGLALCVGALAVRLLGRARATANAARVETVTALLYGLGLVALGLYFLTTPTGSEYLGLDDETTSLLPAALGVAWMGLLVCSLFTLIFVELSYATMPVAGAVELRRVSLSGASGLSLGLALVYMFNFNYAATQLEVRRDLSYFKTSMPSEATHRMVRRLQAPVEVTLFFPRSNEVLERVRPYFDELSSQSKNVVVEVRDHVMAPALTKEHQIRGNGYVLVRRGQQGKAFNVGLELERARRNLKRLDASFQENFSSVIQPERIFYTTAGHGERTNRSRDQAEQMGIADLTTFVRRFGLKHRSLGLAQGLGAQVPEDAAVVAIVGPDRAFLPEEVEALVRYARGGGRLLLMLEPDQPAGLEPLLDLFGLQLEPGRLAHEELHRLLTSTRVDRTSLVTNRYSSHPSVSTVVRAARGVATVFFNAGHLTEKETDGPRVSTIVRAVPGTWADLDGDLQFDGDQENRGNFIMGAAVVLPAAGAGTEGAEGETAEGAATADAAEGRAVVFADGDVFTDRVFRNEGNFWLAADNILWLAGQEELTGQITDEEDRPIEHTRQQDRWWFWSTVVLIPAAVLIFGLVYTSRRRWRREKQEKAS
jgi:hypothetical protein